MTTRFDYFDTFNAAMYARHDERFNFCFPVKLFDSLLRLFSCVNSVDTIHLPCPFSVQSSPVVV